MANFFEEFLYLVAFVFFAGLVIKGSWSLAKVSVGTATFLPSGFREFVAS